MSQTSSDLSGAGNWATVARKPFGETADGRPVELFVLTNAHGLRVDIINYGATIVRLFAPDRDGKSEDVVLGYDEMAGYEAGTSYYGAVVGRFGNRIADGRFTIDDTVHELPTNNQPGGIPCHLHGGPEGFDRQIWTAEVKAEGPSARLTLKHFSPAGHAGYPGNLSASVTYILHADNRLEVIYTAETDAATHVNLTQHTYFNLAGQGNGDIGGHILQLPASHYLPVTAGQIPTGERAPVADTAFDFTSPRPIGAHIDDDDPQIAIAGGFDHCWIYDEADGTRHAGGTVVEPNSGRTLEVVTTEPGVQFYSGKFIKPGDVGKAGKPYGPRSGFCLETQHFPNTPNRPDFPSTLLRPGEVYRSVTVFRFGTT